jgi:DNA-binding XRE family transcriptional regulator
MSHLTVAPAIQALLQRAAGPALLSKHVRHGPYIVDAVILDAHPEIARWYGYTSPADLRGRYLSQLHDAQDLAHVRRYAVARELGWPGVPTVYDIRIHLPNGTQRWLRKHQVQQLVDGADTYWISQSLPIADAQVQPLAVVPLVVSPATLEQYLGRCTMAEAEWVIEHTLPLDPRPPGACPSPSTHAAGRSGIPTAPPPGTPGHAVPPPHVPGGVGHLTAPIVSHWPQRLRHLRQHQGLTQKALAQRAGITDVTISRIEQSPDASQVAIETVVRLAHALGVRLETLLGLDDDLPAEHWPSSP